MSAPASAPVIGVTTYRAAARWGVWDLPAALTPWAYVQAVAYAGGAPVLLPPVGAADAHVTHLDGLVIAGGPDIQPWRYGAEAEAISGPFDPPRDEHELALIRSALALELPMLGICRGMQLLNVALGGTLHQHLPAASAHAAGPGAFCEHRVNIAAGSRVAAALGAATSVRSYHHQGLERLGAGLRISAQADDGTIEAIELCDAAYAVGVLWHPEMGTDRALFAALVAASRRSRPRTRARAR